MLCRYRVLLRCPTCERVFCVPELAGSSVVWHRACGDVCARIVCADVTEHADRADVVYDHQDDRLVLDVKG